MKCIIRNYALLGGAPRSLLQHIIALKGCNFNNIICLASEGDDSLLKEYQETVDTMLFYESPSELWEEKKRWKSYREYKREYELLKKEKPQLVIVLGEINGALYSYICRKLGIPLIIYIPGGEIKTNEKVIELWDQCEVVCFSIENAETIKKHFQENHINVIENRIAIRYTYHDIKTHYQGNCSVINVLIPSRLAKSKIQSIYSFLSLLSKCANKKTQIVVHIAGNGRLKDELTSFCREVSTPYLKIEILGHVDNLSDEFRWAHIVAGKGRSVIEPILMNRIGCIIGEDEKICFCTKDSFMNLYYYNFSGRNMQMKDSLNEMKRMLERIQNKEIEESELEEIARVVGDKYSAEFLPEKLSLVINSLSDNYSEKGNVWLPIQYIRFIIKKIEMKVAIK